ncbi:hypothetical protein P3W24_11265 [Luteibacter sp. PPL201]|uniref:Uncharacterized protein n=1 Tax=Luteibacter sahnii TaxID=3021977 RepID=A0ABT6BC47_9GAMM|nr:hypothetical protein [Luteibacter sp. PPL193]MDY1547516.1 hypothetical protein [Luteibacter sp. PPL193]
MTRPEIDDAPVINSALPDGGVPLHVAPFVMRYGTDVLIAMRRAAEHAPHPSAEPA